MDQKNKIINTKTFEEFKTGNATYYPIVIGICNEILEYLKNNGVNRYNGLVLAGKWDIEGKINTADLTSADETLSKDIFFHDIKNKEDYITIDISGVGKTITDKPGDYETPPEFESEANLDVESVTYYKDGEDFTVAVTTELEKLILQIVEFIAE